MSAGAQANTFYSQVAAEGFVWALGRDGTPLFVNSPDKKVMPVWSSESRAQKAKSEIQDPQLRVMRSSWSDFKQFHLELLDQERILLGLNWSGKNLSGFDLPARLVERSVDALVISK